MYLFLQEIANSLLNVVCVCVCVCVFYIYIYIYNIRIGKGSLVGACSVMSLYDPMDCNPPASSVHGISQARIQELVTISSSRDIPNPGIKPESPLSPAFQVYSLLLSHQEE